MKNFRSLAFAAALFALAACNRAPAPAADHSKPASEPQTALGKVAAKGIEQARKELQTKNLTLNGNGGITVNGRRYGGRNDSSLPKAEITPQGDLLVDGKAVTVTPEQRRQLLEYRSQLLGVAEAGMAVGLKGADLAGKALTESLGSLLTGDTDEFKKKMEAEGKKIEADAMQICAHLGPMLAAQNQLAASLPEFRPYATMTQADVDECGKDGNGASALSDEDKAELREEVRTAVRENVREAIRGGTQTATDETKSSTQ